MQDGHLPRVSGVGGSVRVVHVGGSPDSVKRPRVATVEVPSRRLRSQCAEVRLWLIKLRVACSLMCVSNIVCRRVNRDPRLVVEFVVTSVRDGVSSARVPPSPPLLSTRPNVYLGMCDVQPGLRSIRGERGMSEGDVFGPLGKVPWREGLFGTQS